LGVDFIPNGYEKIGCFFLMREEIDKKPRYLSVLVGQGAYTPIDFFQIKMAQKGTLLGKGHIFLNNFIRKKGGKFEVFQQLGAHEWF
jgi:hypothetical protein